MYMSVFLFSYTPVTSLPSRNERNRTSFCQPGRHLTKHDKNSEEDVTWKGGEGGIHPFASRCAVACSQLLTNQALATYCSISSAPHSGLTAAGELAFMVHI